MIVKNSSDLNIECSFDDFTVTLYPQECFAYTSDFSKVVFSPYKKSYSVLESRDSILLKILGTFDDPFKLRREYHLSVASSFFKENLVNYHQLTLTVHSCFADAELQAYYDYVKVTAENVLLTPDDMEVLSRDEMVADFSVNNKKLVRWYAIWDILIEPILLEIVGYVAIYLLFSIWFGVKALYIILGLCGFSIVVDSIIFCFQRKKRLKRYETFLHLFDANTVKEDLT